MQELFYKSGIIMLPLLVLSVLGLAFFLHRISLFYFTKHYGLPQLRNFIDSSQQTINHIWLIASIAPLFGLLGTVLGIIKCFQAIGTSRPDMQVISLGLSEALITTAAGLFISIPCQIAAHILQHKLDNIEKKHVEENKNG